jgi:myo-inositol 2-dehydrogenase / D-chiro-inositol 1-dehydrogenase
VHSARPLYFFLERYNESYVAEMQAFVDCVLAGTPPPVTGRDGRVPVVMGLAARRSYDLGRPVQLTEIEPA